MDLELELDDNYLNGDDYADNKTRTLTFYNNQLIKYPMNI